MQPCLFLCALLCFVAAPPPQPLQCSPSPSPLLPGVAPGRVWRALPPTALVLAPDRLHTPWVRWSVLITASVGHIAAGTAHSLGDAVPGQIAYPLTVLPSCAGDRSWLHSVVLLPNFFFLSFFLSFFVCLFVCVCFSFVRPALCLGIAMFEDRIEGANLLSDNFFFFLLCVCFCCK